MTNEKGAGAPLNVAALFARQPPSDGYSANIRDPEAHRIHDQLVEGHAKIKDGIGVKYDLRAQNLHRL
ncbi:hypothetical protein At1D1460_50920 (plasmid) [Agrobacterium tumefaciens]|nr:hypothetical protein At1D1460_50920 [Agrobacterium tumefaciens]